ncbi:hypothetical protein CC1G_11789 [Coprinopsis cinerea okayama7|uniref:Uncharacterized protein n=1 Tax=Coprinopsis cinerea (strain Okayama-7 / 130 / ATCC MYA-4618 / FGSC 9003) TaxID=240176 RepID=A8NPK6_COPC7|nr:hypothetical protein CC1G_11789 [Coprinopsis cinerea okayama7\|eukprot:XP_001835355.2 hypothetical protein CC1G_11789 [Coprinopsis cinerea okayama7\
MAWQDRDKPQVRWAVVDDVEMTFNGDWESTSFSAEPYSPNGPPYGGSQHVTTTSGSVTYIVRGTDVTVFGTNLRANATSGGTSFSRGCMADGVLYPQESLLTDRSMNRVPICRFPKLNGTTHNITVEANASRERPIFIDYLMYKPLPVDAATLHPTVLVEHTQHGIVYDAGKWFLDYQRDFSQTSEKGAKVVINFNEPIYGSWALNGGPSQRFEVPRIDPRANASVVYAPAAPMFMTPRLANRGPHKLVVRHESPRSSFTFDYLVVEEGDILCPPGDSYLASQDARKPVAAIKKEPSPGTQVEYDDSRNLTATNVDNDLQSQSSKPANRDETRARTSRDPTFEPQGLRPSRYWKCIVTG